jgi:hypothetical protein
MAKTATHLSHHLFWSGGMLIIASERTFVLYSTNGMIADESVHVKT